MVLETRTFMREKMAVVKSAGFIESDSSVRERVADSQRK